MASKLESLLDEAHQAWPALAGVDDAFRARVAQSDDIAFAADLYLACAAARGVPAALHELERLLARVPEWLRSIDGGSGFDGDVASALRELLLVGERPKLAEYSGHGPLAAWLRVVTVRLGLRLRRNAARLVPEDEAPTPRQTASEDPERELGRRRHRALLQTTLADALADLDPHERAALKLYYLEGLTLDEIGAMFAVHPSTILRRLRGVHQRLLDDLRARMRAALGATATEIDSLVRLVDSQMDLSLRRLLATRA